MHSTPYCLQPEAIHLAAIHQCTGGSKEHRAAAAALLLNGADPLPEGTPLDVALAYAEIERWIARWNGIAKLWAWTVAQGLPATICTSLWTLWGGYAPERMSQNLYRILTGLSNLSWAVVDRFAQSIGITPMDNRREEAAVSVAMQKYLDGGEDTPLPASVATSTAPLLGCPLESSAALFDRIVASETTFCVPRLYGTPKLRTLPSAPYKKGLGLLSF